MWLASYPKSGNTWVRAIVTALSTHPHLFQVNQLSSGAQPFSLAGSLPRLGLDSRWLSFDENDRLRTAFIRPTSPPDDDDADTVKPAVLRKTHEVWRPGLPGREPFPPDATRAAILVVRDPRDVACSFAPFFGVELDEAIDTMGSPPDTGPGQPVHGVTAQPWGSWSDHARSWLGPDVPFPVHLIRYEDLRHDAVATLEPVFAAIGLECTREQLAAAVEEARFERLRESETRGGFREVSPNTRTFFREGRAGGWRDTLSDAQVAAIEADHADVMTELGYELVTAEAPRRALAESRASKRRRGDTSWLELPAHLGIDVHLGDVPDELPDSETAAAVAPDHPHRYAGAVRRRKRSPRRGRTRRHGAMDRGPRRGGRRPELDGPGVGGHDRVATARQPQPSRIHGADRRRGRRSRRPSGRRQIDDGDGSAFTWPPAVGRRHHRGRIP